MYYSVLSIVIFIVVAVPVSYFTTDPTDKSYEAMDQRMLAPFCRDDKLYRKQQLQLDENSHQLKTLISENGEKKAESVMDKV